MGKRPLLLAKSAARARSALVKLYFSMGAVLLGVLEVPAVPLFLLSSFLRAAASRRASSSAAFRARSISAAINRSIRALS